MTQTSRYTVTTWYPDHPQGEHVMTETDWPGSPMSVRRLPDNVYIARGAHSPGDPTAGDPACTMEWASWLAGVPWSDHPECTHPVLAAAARAVNDGLDDGPRQRLAELIPSLVGTADHRDALLARQRLSVRLAAYAAEQVAHLVPPEGREVCEQAIAAARAWAATPTGEAQEAARAAAAAADRAAAYAARAAAAAADRAAAYAACAAASRAASADDGGFYAACAAAAAASAQASAQAACAYAHRAASADDGGFYAACAADQAAAAAVEGLDGDPIGLLRDLIAEHARLTTQEPR